MGFQVSYSFIAIDKFSPALQKMARASERFNRKVEKTSQRLDRAAKKMKDFSRSTSEAGRNMAVGLSAPIGLVGVSALKASASMEVLQIQLETILGSAEKAKALKGNILDFATRTPFQIDEIGQATKQLLGFGIAEKDVMGQMKVLGDISAGSGKNLKELAVIMGDIKGKTKMDAMDVRQFASAGIPVIAEMTKKYKKFNSALTEKDVIQAVSDGLITYEMVMGVFQDMTKEGGRYHNMAARLADTTTGKWSNFKDALFRAGIELGDQVVVSFKLKEVLDDVSEKLLNAAKAYGKWAEKYPTLNKFLLWGLAFTAILGPMLIMIGAVGSGLATLASGLAFIGATKLGGALLTSLAVILKAVSAVTGAFLIGYAAGTLLYDKFATQILDLIDYIKELEATDLSKALKFIPGPIGMAAQAYEYAFGDSKQSVGVDINLNDPGGAVKSVRSTGGQMSRVRGKRGSNNPTTRG